MKTLCFTLIAMCLSPFLSASSLHIFNDSPYTLTVTVLAADGANLGSLKINPLNQMTWQSSYSGAPSMSQTPYTVIFTCPQDDEYGIWTNVSPGANLTATASQGKKSCEKAKDKDSDKRGSARSRDPYLGPPH